MKTTKIIISTITSTLLVSTIVYAVTVSGVITQTITSGDTIGAGWFQQMNDRMEQVCPGGVCPGSGSSPSGAIIAFNLASCPTGWSAADGGGGRPDLRGEFVRGLDSGRGVDAGRVRGTPQGPTYFRSLADQWTSCGGSPCPSLGAWNIEEAGVTVTPAGNTTLTNLSNTQYINGSGELGVGSGDNWSFASRPRNVAFLYCIKN